MLRKSTFIFLFLATFSFVSPIFAQGSSGVENGDADRAEFQVTDNPQELAENSEAAPENPLRQESFDSQIALENENSYGQYSCRRVRVCNGSYCYWIRRCYF